MDSWNLGEGRACVSCPYVGDCVGDLGASWHLGVRPREGLVPQSQASELEKEMIHPNI